MAVVIRRKVSPTPWTYQGHEFDPAADAIGAAGFVYLITHLASGRAYVGKKVLHGMRRPSPTATRRKKTESDWRRYWGSSAPLKALVKADGEAAFRREVLWVCRTRKHMAYLELREQVDRRVLETDTYFNDNIGGKFWPAEAKEAVGLSPPAVKVAA